MSRDLFAEVGAILTEMGGPGSGHWGHRGRKGKRGGSARSRAGAPAGGAKYRTFGTREEAAEYAEKHLHGAEQALQQEIADIYTAAGLGEGKGDEPRLYTPQDKEASALWEWSGDGYDRINNPLRRLGAANAPYKPGRDKYVDALDRFFKRPKATIPEDIEVTRAFGWDFFDDKPVGTIFKDYGFVATTIQPDPRGPIFAHGGGAVKVRVPKGTRGAYLSLYHNRPHEHEVLLDRGQTFKVTQNDERGIVVDVI